MCGHVEHTVGEAPFVVVPGKDTAQAAIEDFRLKRVDGGAVRIVVEVDRDQRLAAEAKDAFEGAFRGGFKGGVEFFDGGLAACNEGEVDGGDVRCGNADGDSVKAACELRQDEADGFGSACGGGDHGQAGCARTTEVFVNGVDGALIACVGMDRRHVTGGDADEVVQDFGHGREAVGCARGVGDNGVLRSQLAVVHAIDDGEVGVFSGGGDEDFLGSSYEMLCGLVTRCEAARAFKDDINTEVFPGDSFGVGFLEEVHLAKVDIHGAFAEGMIFAGVFCGYVDVATESAMDGVILEEVSVGLDGGEVIDGDDFERAMEVAHLFDAGAVAGVAFIEGTQDHSSDAAKSIDGNSKSHNCLLTLKIRPILSPS